MAATYSYDPTKVDDNDFNQMRFELGDTDTAGGARTCVLCDEEYHTLIVKASSKQLSWAYAQFYCVRAIRMKFSFEVNSKVGEMSLSLKDRYDAWNKLYFEFMKKLQHPTASPESLGEGTPDGGHYFRLGGGENPRVAVAQDIPYHGLGF